jgi:hypothetical protein
VREEDCELSERERTLFWGLTWHRLPRERRERVKPCIRQTNAQHYSGTPTMVKMIIHRRRRVGMVVWFHNLPRLPPPKPSMS